MRHDAEAFIGGRWRSGTNGAYTIVNPATGVSFGRAADCDALDVRDAVAAARAAQPSWASTSFAARAQLLADVADRLEVRVDEFVDVEVAETGTTVAVTRSMHLEATILRLRRYAALEESALDFAPQPGPDASTDATITRVPCGVVAAISPYNFPMLAMVGKVAAALLSGNTVVMKPAPQDPLGIALLAGLFSECATPAGVLNLVTGSGPDLGRALVEAPGVDLVSFTGSTTVGQEIFRSGSTTMKQLILELGGKGACVVFDDADLDQVVATLERVWTINAGQVCLAPTRALVQQSRHDELIQRLVERANELVLGDPSNVRSQVGPLISATQRDRVDTCVREAVADGGRVAVGGEVVPGPGFFYSPTLVDGVAPGSSLDQREAFGPVIAVEVFGDDADALSIANGTPFGLHDYVFSRDVERATSFATGLRGASVTVNGFRRHPDAPFGGNQLSGIGRSGHLHGLWSMTTPRVVNVSR